jgi:hypothetical protein
LAPILTAPASKAPPLPVCHRYIAMHLWLAARK